MVSTIEGKEQKGKPSFSGFLYGSCLFVRPCVFMCMRVFVCV